MTGPRPLGRPEERGPWWKSGVLYQIYPRSFADSNGDGIGDLRGHHRPPRPPAVAGRRRRSGSARSPSHPTPTGATTSPTTARSSPTSARSDDSTGSIAEARSRGHPGPARPRAQPHQRPAPVVRRRPFVDGRPPTATGTCGPTPRPTARRPTTGCQQLRRTGLDPRRRHRAVLPPQPPPRAARPQLVERRGARQPSTTSCGSGSTAASPASASTCAT